MTLLSALVLAVAPAATATADTALKTKTASPLVKHRPKHKPARAAKGTLKLYMADEYFVNGQPVTTQGRGVEVIGISRPYVPGQWVEVKAFSYGRLVLDGRYRLRRSPRGVLGTFHVTISDPDAGALGVRVTHGGTTQLAYQTATTTWQALSTNIGFGSTGPMVQLLQQRLQAMHFYVPQTGVYDSGTGLAIDAFHRLLGWGVYQTVDPQTIQYLMNGWGVFQVRDAGDGVHAEGDLTHQLLALINGSQVQWIFPISSGKPSTPTILGEHVFQVYRRDAGYLPDGMYYSSFFTGGYAIHGYDPAPDYPASHGCMRLPIADAIFVYDWLNYGDTVDTYYR